MTMLTLLNERLEAFDGAKLVINHQRGTDGYVMALNLGDAGCGRIEGIAAHVASLEGFEDGYKWMLGQLDALELGYAAECLGDEGSTVMAGPCPHCNEDYVYVERDAPNEAATAAVELAVLAKRLEDGDATTDEAIEAATRVSRVLFEIAGVGGDGA
jgi:hypothetical protein